MTIVGKKNTQEKKGAKAPPSFLFFSFFLDGARKLFTVAR